MNIKIKKQNTDYFRLTYDDKGHIFLYLIYNNLHNQPYALLEDLWVKEKYRNQGVGTKLIKKAILKAKELKCYKILVTSRFERENIHNWYQILGFKKYGYEFRLDLL